MPTAILKFDLEKDNDEFKAALHGREALSALWDIDQMCRNLLRHGEPTSVEREILERVREAIPSHLLEI